VVGITADLESVNELTAFTTAVSNHYLFRMFLHLVEEAPDFLDRPPTFEPKLAERWEWSDDHLALTFHLRDDVVWTDGTPVTAEDVRWTWQAQVHPDVAWEGDYAKRGIRDVEVLDPHTVRFHFTQVYPAQLLHANEGVILPKHAWSQLPFSQWRQSARWFADHLVTNGPFRLESWKPGQELVLGRNERYYEEGLPKLDRVVFRVVPDQSSLLTQLLSGELDFVSGISPEDAPEVESAPHLELVDYWSIGFIFFAWNNRTPYFEDVRVRQALTLALDRFSMVDGLWGPFARVGVSPIISTVWAHNSSLEPWPYNPARARELLAEAGWKDTDGDGLLDRNGRPFRFEMLVHSGNRQRQDAVVMAQEQLRPLGIQLQVKLLDFNAFVAEITAGTYDACIAGLNMGTDLELRYLLHTSEIDSGLNYAHYSNPEVDRLLDETYRQREPADMKPYLDRIQEIIHHDQPLTFLWESKRLNAVNKRLRGAKPHFLSPFANLEEWWIEPAP
jgi:peptide/nickel transport system substrate-binding protein